MKLAGFYWPFVQRCWRPLALGTIASLGIMALRLVLPWPLANWVKPWLHGQVEGARLDVALRGGALFLGIFALLGACDYFARVFFGRFAVDLVVELRHDAPRVGGKTTGDHLARMIGDTARLKEGLKGFLIHVVTNGLLCLGLVITLCVLDIWLGLLFAAGLGATFLMSYSFTRRVSGRAKRLRKREGRLATTIHKQHGASMKAKGRNDRGPQVKPSRARPKASLTVIQGQATWAAHTVLALVLLGCLGVASSSARMGERELIVLLTYLLHSYHPVIRLARQLTRVGKLEACAERVRDVFEKPGDKQQSKPLPGLEGVVEFRKFGLRAGLRGGGGMRIEPMSLTLSKGQRVAVVGGRASGKSSLMASLAQRNRAKQTGELLWDNLELGCVPTRARKERIGLFGSLKAAVRRGKAAGLDVVCVDDGLEGLVADRDVEAALDDFFGTLEGCLILVGMRRPLGLKNFDRVLKLDHGVVVECKP